MDYEIENNFLTVFTLGGVNVGGFDFNLQFNWHAIPEREKKRHKVYLIVKYIAI